MKPIGRIYLTQNGNDEARIGDNKRNTRLPCLSGLESLVESLSPIALTCDINPFHPPYFREFCYLDMLGGLRLLSMSAEVNARIAEKAVALPANGEVSVGKELDKYELLPPAKKHRKVIFLPGSNAVSILDQSALQRLMTDDEWIIKPHPVTDDGMLRDLAAIHGYHRILDRHVSGMALLEGADEVAVMTTSEIFLLARLMGKPVTDLTRFDRAWLTAHFPIARLLSGDDSDVDTINRALTSDLCGYVKPEYPAMRNKEIASAFFAEAMRERENFKMISNQQLRVEDKTIVEWQ